MLGRKVLYGGPTAEQTSAYWENLTTWFAPAIDAGFIKENKSSRKLTFNLSGGQIHARTAYDVDTWRGGYGDVVILDEYAYMKQDPWGKVVRPMLLDNGGEAWFGSTPNRKNHHYKRYKEALLDPDRWSITEFTSHENPHLDADSLDLLVRDMTDDDYQQEIMAKFLESSGMVFTLKDGTLWVPEKNVREQHKGHQLVSGLDLAKTVDFTAQSIGCADCKKELGIWRFRGEANQQARNIKANWLRWGKPSTRVEDNAAVDIIVAMRDLDMMFDLHHTDGDSKPKMVAALKLALERQEWQFVDDPVATSELEDYEESQTRTGRMQYSAPPGEHDDTVIARALMIWQASNRFYFAVSSN